MRQKLIRRARASLLVAAACLGMTSLSVPAYAQAYDPGADEDALNRAYVFEEKLPEVRFDLHPKHLGGGFYQELSLSAAQNGHSFYLTGDTRHETFTTLDGFYRIQKTIPLGQAAQLNLFGGVRALDWQNVPTAVVETLDGGVFRIPYPEFHPGVYATLPMNILTVEEENFSQTIGDIGFNLESEFYRTWDTKNSTWKIDGLKHVVKPYLQMRHNPASEDHGLAYNSDLVFVQDTNLPNWDLATRRDTVFAQEQTLARIGIKNELYTRRKDYGSRQLVSWNLAGDYFFEGPFEDDFSFVYSEISAAPAHWLEVGMFQRFSVDHFKLWELNSRIRIRDADMERWKVCASSCHTTLPQLTEPMVSADGDGRATVGPKDTPRMSSPTRPTVRTEKSSWRGYTSMRIGVAGWCA